MTIPATHTVVKSRPSTHRFGQGILRFIPYAVTAAGYVEPSDDDKAAAALMFADDRPDYDAMAAEFEWHKQFEDTVPPVGHCRSCGEPAELSRDGWCQRCEDLIDVACDSRY